MDTLIQDFESSHPDQTADLNDFLASGNPNDLTEGDIRNIKYLIYTAPEPYRSIYLNSLSKFEMIATDNTDKGAFYTLSLSLSSLSLFLQSNTSLSKWQPIGAPSLLEGRGGKGKSERKKGREREKEEKRERKGRRGNGSKIHHLHLLLLYNNSGLSLKHWILWNLH